jgi:signal transduction histidine kinase
MGEMINNNAHQWCQPLNALGLIVQQLPIFYDSAEFSREFLEENTEKSLALIRHMSQTINVFRDFFKPDKGKITFGVKQVIGHTLSLIEQSFKEHQINIALHSDCEPMVYGYSNEYAQVLMNILMNARDALAGHTVDAARISIHAFTEGSAAVVTIADNAGGIDDETIGRVFDPYFTTKGPDKGTGIGLFMSKTIIERNMGGRLTVRNTGNGAEFRIEV